MGTKIEIPIRRNGITNRKKYSDLVYYCKESPSEVLKKLFKKYHISRFNDLRNHWGASIESSGLIIEEFGLKEGLIPSRSIKNYKPSVSKKIIAKCISPEGYLRDFIKSYLIEEKVIDEGSGIENVVTGQKIPKRYGKQKAVEYIIERKKQKDPEKEKYFKEILKFGKIVMEGKFDLNIMKKMSHEIAKEIPTKIEPRYAQLGGISKGGGFGFFSHKRML